MVKENENEIERYVEQDLVHSLLLMVERVEGAR